MPTPFLRSLCVLPVLWLFLLQPLRAAEVEGLYEAHVAVDSQSAGERTRAIAEGFRQVVVKVSGQRSVLGLPAIQGELGKAESLLGSYRYETVAPRASGTADAAAQGPLYLRLAFDPASVRAILNRSGAPVWGASRPPVYLWLVREGPQGGTLFALGTPQADVLLDAAAQRGLPAIIPPPGAAVAGEGGAAEVPAVIHEAATRAGAKLVLAASVGTTVAGRVRASGALSIDGAVERLEATGTDEAGAIRALVAETADRLGAHYAVVARQDQVRTVRLRVSGIASLVVHAGLERWLDALPLVKDVMVSEVGGDRVDYQLMLAGEVDRLLQAMTADGRFASIGTPSADGAVTTIDAVLAGTSSQ